MKVVYIFILVLPVLLMVAFFTVFERVIIGNIQRRTGRNLVGWQGVLQAIADALKLISKEFFKRLLAQTSLFVLSPVFIFMISILNWSVIPLLETAVLADLNLGLIFLLILAMLGVYGVLLSGWSSNSKYSLIGSLRSTAQMLGYDITVTLVLFTIIIVTGSLNFIVIINFQTSIYLGLVYPLILVGAIINGLAETNRVPFDLREAEAELVSGYNTEYSGIGFTLFFLSEYSSIIVMAITFNMLFLGGWN